MEKKSKIFLVVLIGGYLTLAILVLMVQGKIENRFMATMPMEVKNLATKNINYLFNKKYNELVNLFVDGYKQNPGMLEEISTIGESIKQFGRPMSKKIVGYHYINNNGKKEYEATYTLQLKKTILLLSIVVIKKNNTYKLHGFNIKELEEPLEETYKFSLRGKSIGHFIVLILGILSMLFSFITAAICYGTNMKGRILWTILILLGIVSLTIDWTTGTITGKPISIGLPCFIFGRASRIGMYIVGVRFPIFAILYWIKRKNMLRQDDLLEQDDTQSNCKFKTSGHDISGTDHNGSVKDDGYVHWNDAQE